MAMVNWRGTIVTQLRLALAIAMVAAWFVPGAANASLGHHGLHASDMPDASIPVKQPAQHVHGVVAEHGDCAGGDPSAPDEKSTLGDCCVAACSFVTILTEEPRPAAPGRDLFGISPDMRSATAIHLSLDRPPRV